MINSVAYCTMDAAEPLNGFILIGLFAIATSVTWELRPFEFLMTVKTARVKLDEPILIDRIPTIRDKYGRGEHHD
jgi:hypothetical protein